jgi:DNA ligase-1
MRRRARGDGAARMRRERARMPDLEDGESIEVQGSGSNKYVLRNMGEVYSCTCPAWRNQSVAIERRTCKHLKALRGEAAELARVSGSSAAGAAGGAGGTASGASAGGAAQPKAKSGGAGASAKAEQEGPPILLANPWDNAQDLTGWWMSEKLDGVRAYWDGKAFISRLGNRYHAPAWFTQGLPDFPLDGELWGGRKRFQRTVSVVRRQDMSSDWKEISFLIFDAPASDAPFEERLELCKRAIAEGKPAYAKYHEHELCKGLPHLREELRRVEALGGEGLMMRRPGSRYEVGRSASLLKVKSFFDAEARVLEHQPGTGKHKGRLGALLVELPDGTRFSIGTGFSDKERQAPPPIGAVVTFRYQELSDAGVPRFPSYVGVRHDIKWPPDNALTRKATDRAPSDSVGESASANASASASAKANGGGGGAPKAAGKKASPKAGPEAAAAPSEAATQAAAPTAPTPETPAKKASGGVWQPGVARRLELSDGGTTKAFVEIEVRGRSLMTREGRSWASGQSKTTELESEDAALREAEARYREKIGEGYREA